MAKKKTGATEMSATKVRSGTGKVHFKKTAIRHARIELEADDYEGVRKVAKSNGLSIAAYIRMAVLQRLRHDRAAQEGGSK
jgi:hypothetical protein